MGAVAEAERCEAEARAEAEGVWFRVEPGGAEHTRGPVWARRWGGQARQAKWLSAMAGGWAHACGTGCGAVGLGDSN